MSENKKKGGGTWSKSGILTTGSVDNKIQLDQAMPEPSNYTVQFSLTPDPLAAYTLPIECQADIIWKVDGQSIKRTVTVGQGVSVTGTADAVTVIVTDSTDVSGGVFNYEVGIQISKGSRASVQQPPTLVPDGQDNLTGTSVPNNFPGFFSVAPGQLILIPVPQDAGIISVFITASAWTIAGPVVMASGDAMINHISYGNAPTRIYDPNTKEWVPVTSGTSFIKLFNYFAGATYAIFYSVTFGIDG